MTTARRNDGRATKNDEETNTSKSRNERNNWSASKRSRPRLLATKRKSTKTTTTATTKTMMMMTIMMMMRSGRRECQLGKLLLTCYCRWQVRIENGFTSTPMNTNEQQPSVCVLRRYPFFSCAPMWMYVMNETPKLVAPTTQPRENETDQLNSSTTTAAGAIRPPPPSVSVFYLLFHCRPY